jgi:hypothetical protein
MVDDRHFRAERWERLAGNPRWRRARRGPERAPLGGCPSLDVGFLEQETD